MTIQLGSAVYRQLRDSNSQWHKKLQKVPVAGCSSWGTSASFSNFVSGKNLTPHSVLNDPQRMIEILSSTYIRFNPLNSR